MLSYQTCDKFQFKNDFLFNLTHFIFRISQKKEAKRNNFSNNEIRISLNEDPEHVSVVSEADKLSISDRNNNKLKYVSKKSLRKQGSLKKSLTPKMKY